jgi:alkanesulfonate monooxygenase SsuD/methylene tetrahydromethanopterin reductase-like flavin-dependent oxidoreductase (luciferase family)
LKVDDKEVGASGHSRFTFGININPYSAEAEKAFALAREADDLGIDMIGIQDHPYNGSFLDTWTLISTLAASTKRVRFFPNVADLPLRPPAMLAKAVATLDVITKGRVELGIGAGAFWPAIVAYGGQTRTPSEAVAALEEAIQVIRFIWDYEGKGRTRASFKGKHYHLDNAQTGPRPYHKVGIWIGAYGTWMLRLTGRLGDGWSPSLSYLLPDQVESKQKIIDEAMAASGRPPTSVIRNYNVFGTIRDSGSDESQDRMASIDGEGAVTGSAEEWANRIVWFNKTLGFNSVNFWPSENDETRQIRLFAERVITKVREKLAVERG